MWTLRNGERKCKTTIVDEKGWNRGRREGQVVTSAPYGKMQKGATVNWTRHTNSSSFSSSQECRISFSSSWLFKLSEEGCKTDDRTQKQEESTFLKIIRIIRIFYRLMHLSLSRLIISIRI